MGRRTGTAAPVNRFELYGALAPLVEQNGAVGLTRQDAPATADSDAPTAAEASTATAKPAATAARPPRADAVRNRAKVLAAASEAFAAEGLAVPLDEIARRAGVGAGTVYRHFPTKEALFEAVITDRLLTLADDAEARLASGEDAGEAFFAFFYGTIYTGLAKADLAEALASAGVGLCAELQRAAGRLRAGLDALLKRAQEAGAVRSDVSVEDLHALAKGAMAAEKRAETDPNIERGKMTRVICDGLRA